MPKSRRQELPAGIELNIFTRTIIALLLLFAAGQPTDKNHFTFIYGNKTHNVDSALRDLYNPL
ncbi:MAG: hypothetical protein AMJ65_05480 [Phycisphaerae bacterium SG8_4]|nr:MAG: hypothetical protein AMJ65_05480 [Phycisphaerae bacterium SG8_4]